MSLSSQLLVARCITGFIRTPMLLLIKSSQFYVLLLNLLDATLHHFLPRFLPSPSTLNYSPSWYKYETFISYLNNFFFAKFTKEENLTEK